MKLNQGSVYTPCCDSISRDGSRLLGESRDEPTRILGRFGACPGAVQYRLENMNGRFFERDFPRVPQDALTPSLDQFGDTLDNVIAPIGGTDAD